MTLLVGLVAGCEADPALTEERRVDVAELPFTFSVRTDFTRETIDHADTRGEVLAGFGLTKVDVIAVRRVGALDLPEGPVRHEVQGESVTSELHPVRGGYAIECQYTSARAETVRAACRDAVDSVTQR